MAEKDITNFRLTMGPPGTACGCCGGKKAGLTCGAGGPPGWPGGGMPGGGWFGGMPDN